MTLKTIIGSQGVVTSKVTEEQEPTLELEVPLKNSNSILNVTQAVSPTTVGSMVETIVFHVAGTAILPEIAPGVLGRKIFVLDLSEGGAILSGSNSFMNYNSTATTWQVQFQDQTYSTVLTAISSSAPGASGLVWFDSDTSGLVLADV